MTPIIHLLFSLHSQLLWLLEYTREQARVTADVAGLEKRADKTDASIKELKTEIMIGFEGVKTELKSAIEGIRTDMQGVKTELKGDMQEVKTELKDVRGRMTRGRHYYCCHCSVPQFQCRGRREVARQVGRGRMSDSMGWG